MSGRLDDRAGGTPPFEGTIEVVRTARFSQLGEISPATRQVWFVCHGYRQLASRFIRRFSSLPPLAACVVAPEALSRFYIEAAPGRHGTESRIGASWMTRADRESEIRDYVRYLDKLAARILAETGKSRPRIVVLGFSQGVHTAARWVGLGNTKVDELVLWGAYLPPDLDVARLAGVGLNMVYGDTDPTADANLARGQEERLHAAGITPRRHSFAGGHTVDGDVVAALALEFEP